MKSKVGYQVIFTGLDGVTKVKGQDSCWGIGPLDYALMLFNSVGFCHAQKIEIVIGTEDYDVCSWHGGAGGCPCSPYYFTPTETWTWENIKL